MRSQRLSKHRGEYSFAVGTEIEWQNGRVTPSPTRAPRLQTILSGALKLRILGADP